MTFYRLLEACGEEGCPLCRLVTSAVERYLDGLLYESVNDGPLRERLRKGGGFCSTHAWQLAHTGGAALGVAILARDVLDAALLRLEVPQSSAPDCPACDLATTTTTRYVDELIAHGDDPDVQAAFRSSSGLCLPHLTRALAAGLSDALKAIAIEKLQSLIGELDEFIRKHDCRFIGQGFGPEGTSWLRATAALAGREK